ncbi:DNA/RNA polymerase [Thelephora ganbajun]|uniref:DNA/RNA polymerase n=1 Tax=Thelephora ganbajun TaxID=370292 RepID=A0ACB6ZWI9_THEGA|nr:DNA/RNA polymerase [Thelephora ganbajun]
MSSQTSESLLKRLAGPSTGKAGLAKDQTEINRIIAEASKGSRFYENEKRKDKDLTERIAKLLKRRDEVTKGVDLVNVECAADKIIADLEAHRDLSQYIVHVDMDAFYASVELLRDPSLAGKPFAVGGMAMLSTASYDARKFGVRSGMPGFIAKKLCPELIMVDHHFDHYMDISGKIMNVFREYDPNMFPAGCDEGFLKYTTFCSHHALDVAECVQQMRDRVRQEMNLTVSAGIAPNMICSDKNKPNGQFHLEFDPEVIRGFMRELPIRKIPGIGRVTERLLDAIRVKSCGDVYTHRSVLVLMDKEFGMRSLFSAYLGIGSNVVEPWGRGERKSIGAERTFNPLEDKIEILRKLEEVAEELEGDMAEKGWAGRTVTLKFKRSTYEVCTRAKATDHWVTKKDDLLNIGKELLMPEFHLSLRLIGLRVTKLKDLREDEKKGIKRFFEPAGANQTGSSKRQRTSGEMRSKNHDDDEPWSGERPEEPLGRSQLGGTIPPSRSTSASEDRIEQCCPVCSRTLLMDNQGLNEHIDFCLSRDAIREARSSAGVR